MHEGLSVRAASCRLGIHRDTAWRWRHRLLTALAPHERELLHELVDVGQGLFPHSEKGARNLQRPHYSRRYLDPDRPLVRVLFARDVHGRSYTAVLTTAPLYRPTTPEIREHLLPRLAPVCVLRSLWGRYGPFASIARLATGHGGPSTASPKGRSFERASKTRVIPEYRFRLRRWMRRFRGVSSRYLSRYLCWFRLVDPAEAESRVRRLLRMFCD